MHLSLILLEFLISPKLLQMAHCHPINIKSSRDRPAHSPSGGRAETSTYQAPTMCETLSCALAALVPTAALSGRSHCVRLSEEGTESQALEVTEPGSGCSPFSLEPTACPQTLRDQPCTTDYSLRRPVSAPREWDERKDSELGEERPRGSVVSAEDAFPRHGGERPGGRLRSNNEAEAEPGSSCLSSPGAWAEGHGHHTHSNTVHLEVAHGSGKRKSKGSQEPWIWVPVCH